MVLFPNQTITYPDAVRERITAEYRKHNGGAKPRDIVEQASRDSFPASDAPPWTLGRIGPHARPAETSQGVPEPVSIKGGKMRKERTLIISDVDRERLEALIESVRMDSRVREGSLTALEVELERARVVPAGKVPADVVTMGSVVRLRDLDTEETETCELVYPADADMAANRISVLAPVGTAILGYRLGDVIEWPVPAGLRRLRLEAVVHQPERIGVLHR